MSELERRVRDAGTAVDWPDTDLSGPVVARIEARERPGRGHRWMQVAVAAAAIALLVLATPTGRQAVADLLEVAGIRVQWGEETIVPGAGLELGTELGLDDVRDRASFPLLFPVGGDVGAPDAVYHSDFPPGGAVHLVWESGPSLPAAEATAVGLLYSQFQGSAPGFVKSVQPGSDAREVEVRGEPGFWIEGAPHIIFYEDQSGVQERARLAANVLAWEEDGLTHRIETTRGLAFALELAESLQPLP